MPFLRRFLCPRRCRFPRPFLRRCPPHSRTRSRNPIRSRSPKSSSPIRIPKVTSVSPSRAGITTRRLRSIPLEDDWWDFELGRDEVNFYLGMNILPGFGFVHDLNAGSISSVEASFLWAMKLGLFFGATALEVEFAPVTWLPVVVSSPPAYLSANLGLGTYNQLTSNVFWPTRFALGVAHSPSLDDTRFLTRLDIIGVSFNLGHVMIDLTFPSFRTATDFSDATIFNFLFGVGGSYIF